MQVLVFFGAITLQDPPFFNTIETFLGNVQNWLFGLGVTVFAIGVIVGGLMRATAFGSERRIAASNAALSCAVIGFIIVLLSQVLPGVVQGLFPG